MHFTFICVKSNIEVQLNFSPGWLFSSFQTIELLVFFLFYHKIPTSIWVYLWTPRSDPLVFVRSVSGS